MTAIPQPIVKFIDSSNRGDAAAVVTCFTPSAILHDWGRHFEGHEGIAAWDRTDNTGVQAHIDPVRVKTCGDTVVVTVKVSGNGFNGTGHMHFQLEGERIARLDIK
ncbi:nuclear transport factor 2 family protein [Burkholderia sp. SCN-KJ]|uniref:nuclear transport factor 2 family protein n=1 Tax=Burkholderia sp. SCN-KJ TaxID=2969248 RepID=UPI0035AE87DA